MPNRKEERIDTEIGGFAIAGYSRANRDLFKIIKDVHGNYKFGILLADIMGHEKKEIKNTKKRLWTKRPPIWYQEESASNALFNLCRKINEEEKTDTTSWGGKTDQLLMSAMIYILFGNNTINYANSAMNYPIIIKKGNLEVLTEKNRPIGFFKYQRENISEFTKRDLLILYTDGLIENCLESRKIPEALRQKANIKTAFPKDSNELLKVKNPPEHYEEQLIKLIEKHPQEKLENLVRIVKSKIEEEQYKLINVEKEIIKEYHKKVDAKIQMVIKETKNDFKKKLFNTFCENHEKTPSQIIDYTFERYYNHIFPENVEKSKLDDVSLIIAKRL